MGLGRRLPFVQYHAYLVEDFRGLLAQKSSSSIPWSCSLVARASLTEVCLRLDFALPPKRLIPRDLG